MVSGAARLRLQPGVDLSGFTPEVQKIFRAMQRYGLIMADNGSDLYVSGTHDNRWDNGVLNPAFAESWMLAILFMNIFSSLIDHFVIQANIRRRMVRYAA